MFSTGKDGDRHDDSRPVSKYLPLPATADAIAALILALARDDRDLLRADAIWNMR
jgi:hypothetical protein